MVIQSAIEKHSGVLDFAMLFAAMKKQWGITEELKAKDQLAWVGAMNNIRSAAEEIICTEVIYV